MTKTREFTEQYPNSNYKPTLNSKHEQTKFWPEYLPVDKTRMFIFERSKNAQLVVYTSNMIKGSNRFDPKWPLDINWQSYGWTDSPTTNGTGMVERKMAWGYSHTPCETDNQNNVIKYNITLSAMPTRQATLYINDQGIPVLETEIGGKPARLVKIFVQAAETRSFIPRVEYVEIFGHTASGEDAYEKHIP